MTLTLTHSGLPRAGANAKPHHDKKCTLKKSIPKTWVLSEDIRGTIQFSYSFEIDKKMQDINVTLFWSRLNTFVWFCDECLN